MVASVRDLILAAQAQAPRSPIASVLENFVAATNQQTFQRPAVDTALRLAQLRQIQNEERRTQEQAELDKITAKNREEILRREEKRVKEGKAEMETIIGPKGGITRKIKGISPTDKSKANEQERRTALQLMKDLSNRPEVRDAILVEGNVRSMDALLESALQGNINNRIALEQGLITMFNKITDPGSVVRESEFARTPENAPVVNRFSGALQRLFSGGVGLTNADREALVIGAKVIANERMGVARRTVGNFENVANRLNLDKSIVTGTTPDFKMFDISKPRFDKTKKQSSSIELPPGFTFEELFND